MGLTDIEKQELLKDLTNQILSNETGGKKSKPEGSFKDIEGSRLPVTYVKRAGQPTSKSGFPKGPVGMANSWLPEE